MRIDSHHHFWRYDPAEYAWIDAAKASLQRDFLPVDLDAERATNGIDAVISVQARQSLQETHALLGFALRDSWIKAVVGWVPLQADNLVSILESLSESSRLRGVRHVVQDEPDHRFMLRADFLRGVARLREFNLVYDVLVYPHQLPAAIALADHFPEQVFVLDHLGKPRISSQAIDQQWQTAFVELAKRPNVSCKFSGLITEVCDAQWDAALIKPYWEIACQAFGPQRLMFGTDWPVCLLRGSYSEWTETVKSFADQLTASEQQSFWQGAVTKAYLLDAD